MIQVQVLTRVLSIRSGDQTGTAFTYEHNGTQYVITALHVASGDQPIDVLQHNQWHPTTMRRVWSSQTSDLVAFVPETRFPHDLPCPPFTLDGITLGQSAFILGYPMQLRGGSPPTGYPIPLVRRCTLSWLGFKAEGENLLILDGIATPGFSGGPLVFHPQERANEPPRIGGVVLGFFPEVLPVEFDRRNKAEKPALTVNANSGLMMCAAIETVTKAILAL